jgi:hypothetical protein
LLQLIDRISVAKKDKKDKRDCLPLSTFMKVLLELYALSASGLRGVSVEEYLLEIEEAEVEEAEVVKATATKATATKAAVIADGSCAFVAEHVQYAITKLIELKVVDSQNRSLVLRSQGWASLENILEVLFKTSRITRFPIVLWDVERPNVISRSFYLPSEECSRLVYQRNFLRCFDKNTVHIRFEVNHYELSQATESIDSSHFNEFFAQKLSLTPFSGKLLTHFL